MIWKNGWKKWKIMIPGHEMGLRGDMVQTNYTSLCIAATKFALISLFWLVLGFFLDLALTNRQQLLGVPVGREEQHKIFLFAWKKHYARLFELPDVMEEYFFFLFFYHYFSSSYYWVGTPWPITYIHTYTHTRTIIHNYTLLLLPAKNNRNRSLINYKRRRRRCWRLRRALLRASLEMWSTTTLASCVV